MTHTCHARGCEVPVRPTLLMCARHWRLVPASIQREVYATYRRGQCDDKRPSREWHDAASAAIAFVEASSGSVRLSKNEAASLVRRGFGPMLIDAYCGVRGEEYRAAVTKVVGEMATAGSTERKDGGR